MKKLYALFKYLEFDVSYKNIGEGGKKYEK